MLESLTKKQKIIFFIILLFMISIIIYYIYSTIYLENSDYFNSYNTLTSDELIENTSISTLNNKNSNTIIVYICGAVKNSKVITLNENSRICDAIDAVGGLTDDADLTNINLAYILEDGEKIYIPRHGEEIPTSASNFITDNSSINSQNKKININKASQTELETIPGIGPSTALKIINYREQNGKFNSIEDIKNVSGIGDVKYENIKNYITIK